MESPRSSFTHLSGTWATVTRRLGSAGTVDRVAWTFVEHGGLRVMGLLTRQAGLQEKIFQKLGGLFSSGCTRHVASPLLLSLLEAVRLCSGGGFRERTSGCEQ